MIAAEKTTAYRAFGLRLNSELPLPELPQADLRDDVDTIDIRYAELAGEWRQLDVYRKFYAARDGRIFLHIPDTATFCMEEGKRILVSPEPAGDRNKIRLYLLGTCMGALLMQRRILPLHGSAVVIDGKAYAFVGDSGAGKSTLAAAFLAQGHPLLTDDVIAVTIGGDGIPLVMPAYPQQKLWQESLDHLGMAGNGFQSLYDEIDKYAVPVASSFHRMPVPLAAVFELGAPEGEAISVKPVTRLERFPLMLYHTYRSLLIPLMELEQWHFSSSAAIMSKIDIYRMRRPVSGFSAHDLYSRIKQIALGEREESLQ